MRVHLLYVVYRHIHINDIGRKTEHVLLERILQGSGGGHFKLTFPGLLSNQGEKSINYYFIMVPLGKKY